MTGFGCRMVLNAAARAAAFVIGTAGMAASLGGQGSPGGERGAAALAAALASAGTTGRVLTIAAHPDDEDTPIIAWLARGHHVETAYLSLTRGDGGQNLIGNEVGEALGALRTQELLAARRLDGGRQYFTRAYDFGFSKSAEETYRHWPKDSILGDVVRVMRAFRPHVVIAFFTGTPRDGHGHHQVSGLLAREAYDAVGDTVRFPVAGYGLPWTPAKFYRSARQAPERATLRVNTGAYDPVSGRSHYEIAADSRSQHKSQGFGMLQEKGVRWGYLTREASRVGPERPDAEQSLFDGVDTTWAGVADRLPPSARPVLDSALAALAAGRARYRPDTPDAIVPLLAQAHRQLGDVSQLLGTPPPLYLVSAAGTAAMPATRGTHADPALHDAVRLTRERVEAALVLASGVAVEATAARSFLPMREAEATAVEDSLAVRIAVYNRGRTASTILGAQILGVGRPIGDPPPPPRELLPDSMWSVDRWAVGFELTSPWWRVLGRQGDDWFHAPIDARDERQQQARSALTAAVTVRLGGEVVTVRAPIVYRTADPVQGDVQRAVMVVPGVTVQLGRPISYIRADLPVTRTLAVRVRSAYPHAVTAMVQLDVPPGLVADSSVRVRTLAADEEQTVLFTVRGRLPEGRHGVRASVRYAEVVAANAAYAVEYPHIDPIRLHGAAVSTLSAVRVAVDPAVRVGYLTGVADPGLEVLQQLAVRAEPLEASRLGDADLSRYTTIVLGPRAYETHPSLIQYTARLLDFVRRGGTLVVQYGAQNMNTFPGVTPYPLQWAARAARVTQEDAPIRVLDPTHPLLTTPNRITARDWVGWVQERATYMPERIDPRYTALLAMQDPGEPEQRGALLTTALGSGRYSYVTLALFRQLEGGVPGAARLLVNLIETARGTTGPR